MIANLTETLERINAVNTDLLVAAVVYDQAQALRDRMAAQRAAIRDDERDCMDIDPFGIDAQHD